MAPEGELVLLQAYCRELEASCTQMKERIRALEHAALAAEAERDAQVKTQIDLLQALMLDLSQQMPNTGVDVAIGRTLRRLLNPFDRYRKSALGLTGGASEFERTVEELRRLVQALILGSSR